MSSLETAIGELRRPFTPAALKWKVQVNPKGSTGRAMLVCYIDARLAAERLNKVCPGAWSDAFTPVEGGLLCTLTIGDVSRSDVGWSSGRTTDIDLKALYSDAFKRAAVKFGVGVSIYALPKSYLPASDLKASSNGKSWFMTDSATEKLRKTYEKWLKSDEAKVFGEPLDHGDALDAQGDIEADPSSAEPDDPTPVSPARSRSKATAPPPAERGPDGPKDGSQTTDGTLVTPDQLKQLRATFDASGQTDEQLCWFLLSVGVESLPENPDKPAIGAAMRGLTLEQAFKLDALLKGEDESVPGAS